MTKDEIISLLKIHVVELESGTQPTETQRRRLIKALKEIINEMSNNI